VGKPLQGHGTISSLGRDGGTVHDTTTNSSAGLEFHLLARESIAELSDLDLI
jgi:hypothetical protein